MTKKHFLNENDWSIPKEENDIKKIVIDNGHTWEITRIYFSSSGRARLKIYYLPDGETPQNPFKNPPDTTPFIVVVVNANTKMPEFNDGLYIVEGNGTRALGFVVKNLEFHDSRVDVVVIGDEN